MTDFIIQFHQIFMHMINFITNFKDDPAPPTPNFKPILDYIKGAFSVLLAVVGVLLGMFVVWTAIKNGAKLVQNAHDPELRMQSIRSFIYIGLGATAAVICIIAGPILAAKFFAPVS